MSTLLADFAQDVRHAFRLFRSSPGFAWMVIATVAAGITAATTVFSMVDPLLFRSLPFRDAQQLVSVGVYAPVDTNEFAMGGMYGEWRDHQTVFSALTAMRPGTQCDLEIAQTERVPCAAVQRNFLPTLGVAPIFGRNFTRAEDQPHAPRTILISNRIWREYFGSQPDVLNRVVKLDDLPVRIVGILPSDFVLPQGEDVDILLPAQLDERLLRDPKATVFLRAFARLKKGISVEQARQRMAPLFRLSIRTNVRAEVGSSSGRFGAATVIFLRSGLDKSTLVRWVKKEAAALDPTTTATLEPMPERLHGPSDRPHFLTFVLLAGAGLYGVIAFLVSSRTREFGIRSALGATRRDLLLLVQRQTLWCAGVGIALGLCGSVALTGLVRGLLFEISPRDPSVLASAALCLFGIALLAALKPSWKAAHIDPAQALRAD